MRVKCAALLLSSLALADTASATTVIVYTNPMTLDRRTVVLDTPGPDRAFLCMEPPAQSGCIRIPVRRGT